MGRVRWAGAAAYAIVGMFSASCANHPSSSPTSLCRPQQLSAEVSGPDGTGGPAEYRITIRDQGTACSLHGTPTILEGVERSGRVVHVRTTPMAQDWIAGTTTRKAANLAHGASADVVLLTGIACPDALQPSPNLTFQSLRLGIRTGMLDIPFGQGPDPSDPTVTLPCDVAISKFYASFTILDPSYGKRP